MTTSTTLNVMSDQFWPGWSFYPQMEQYLIDVISESPELQFNDCVITAIARIVTDWVTGFSLANILPHTDIAAKVNGHLKYLLEENQGKCATITRLMMSTTLMQINIIC